MSERNLQPSRGNKPLLAAADSKEESESSEQATRSGSGGPSKDTSKLPKRSKVTAVACQPCQKRKSKCDGARPICSSCSQKGRTDCVYDSASDQRRTSALKQRIDGLHAENSALKDILLSICSAFNAQNFEPTIRLVQQTVQQGDFSRVSELAEVLRKNTQAMTSGPNVPHRNHSAYESQGGQYPQPQQIPYPYMAPNPNMMGEGVRPSPTTVGQSEWSSSGMVPNEHQDQEMVPPQSYQGGPYLPYQ